MHAKQLLLVTGAVSLTGNHARMTSPLKTQAREVAVTNILDYLSEVQFSIMWQSALFFFFFFFFPGTCGV